MKRLLPFLTFLLLVKISFAQVTGEYRSKKLPSDGSTFRWTTAADWEVYNGTSWVSASIAPVAALSPKPSRITIQAPTVAGAVFYCENTVANDMTTTTLVVQDGAILQLGYDNTFSCYLSVGSLFVKAGGVFRVPTENIVNGAATVTQHSFYTQDNTQTETFNGVVNAQPGKFIGEYSWSSGGTNYIQRLQGYLGNGLHTPPSANVIYPAVSGSWAQYGSLGVLPLRLVSFEAKIELNASVLTWRTLDEENVSRFEIEKSKDGKLFSSFLSVAAKNGERNNYQARDHDVLSGVTYYRLKMIDLDGTYKYSDIVAVNNKVIDFSIYPNPASESISVRFAEVREEGTVSIYNIQGQLIKKLSLTKGATSVSLSVGDLASGTYMIMLDIATEKAVSKFVKL